MDDDDTAVVSDELARRRQEALPWAEAAAIADALDGAALLAPDDDTLIGFFEETAARLGEAAWGQVVRCLEDLSSDWSAPVLQLLPLPDAP